MRIKLIKLSSRKRERT